MVFGSNLECSNLLTLKGYDSIKSFVTKPEQDFQRFIFRSLKKRIEGALSNKNGLG